MARSHIAVALSAALIACLILTQLLFTLGLPAAPFWPARLRHGAHDAQQDSLLIGKQSGELVDDASSYVVGVGKADITGWVGLMHGPGEC